MLSLYRRTTLALALASLSAFASASNETYGDDPLLPAAAPPHSAFLADKPTATLDEYDFAAFAHAVLQGQLDRAQIAEFRDRLSESQRELALLVFGEVGAVYPRDALPPLAELPPAATAKAVLGCDPGAAPFCWRQMVEENIHHNNQLISPVAWIQTTRTCDNDPDLDYVFVFRMNANNPDAIRFVGVGNPLVAIPLSFSGPFNTYGVNNWEARVCVNNTTVNVVGGPARVMESLRLYTR